jgi:glycosyltransferase involved in cell wall biosynthesis
MPEAVLHHGTGVLVERGDPGALADGIALLLADEPLRRRLGRQAAESLTRFDPACIAEQLLDLYRAALRR